MNTIMVNSASEVRTAKWLLKLGYPSVAFHNRMMDRIWISIYNLSLLISWHTAMSVLQSKYFAGGYIDVQIYYLYCGKILKSNI